MAVIQTIRNKYGKIAGGIIAVALVGFIVSDAASGSMANFFSNRDPNVMEVNGKKIDPKEYTSRVHEYEMIYNMYNQGRTIDEETRANMSEQLVQMLVYEAAVEDECDKLGIVVTDAEKNDLIYGANADQMIRQFQLQPGTPLFSNPETNAFDPTRVRGFEKELADNGSKIDPDGKIRELWASVKNYVQRSARVRKFTVLFTNSAYVPKFEMKRSMAEQNATASIQYLRVPYTSVTDNEVKVSDEEIKAYMNEHAALYTNDEATRNIDYVSFEIVPATADSNRILNALADLREDFLTTKDNKSFVNSRSDEFNSYTETFYNKRTFTSRYADTIMKLPVGDIYGPYYENGSYNLIKVTDRQVLPDSARIRHILVMTQSQGNEVRSEEAATQRMDSAIAFLNSGVPFDSVAQRFSDDQGSIEKGGEYTFTLRDRPGISKEFGDFAFEGKVGESKKVKVSNDNYSGFHYIEILEHNGIAPSIQIAIVAKNLVPSDSTVNALYGKANEFAGKNTTADKFNAAAKELHYDVRIGDNVKVADFSINGLGPAREIVRWMYEHNLGDISDVFQLSDKRYVVAKLSAINAKGLKALTAANKPMLEQKVKEQKKAKLISDKYAGKSLEAIAAETQQEVMQSDSVTLAGKYIPNLGYEPAVIGYTFDKSFQPNTVSPGIIGQGGVYFITVLNRVNNPLPPDGGMMDQIVAQQRRQRENQMKNVIDQSLQQSITKKANVEYFPSNF